MSIDISTPVVCRPQSARFPLSDKPLSDKPHLDKPLLEKLRGAGMTRPQVDPELAGGLREWLEDALAIPAASLPSRSPVIRVNKQVLSGSGVQGLFPGPADQLAAARDHVLSSLVRCLFRQWVTTRRFGHPMEDALAALAALADPGGTVEAVNRLSPERRRTLAEQVAEHARRIAATWPVLCPAWYPRTSERISIPLCGGRILLSGVVDLVIGAQAAEEATVCIVQVDTAPRSTGEFRTDLHFQGLLETLRAGASPCRVARYSTDTGELYVEPVDEHLLVSSLLKTVDVAGRECEIRAQDAVTGAGRPR